MNNRDSDLEEGEILDDSPPSPAVRDKKGKELPRRYVVRESKHKRDCKYAIHYHAKKLSNLKKKPFKGNDTNRKHHKSTCSHEKSHEVLDRYNSSGISKNGHSFSHNSLIAEMKSSCKDFILKKQSKKFESKAQHIKTKNDSSCISKTQDLKASQNDFSDSKLHKKCKNHDFQPENNLICDSVKNHDHLSKSGDDLPKVQNVNSVNAIKNVKCVKKVVSENSSKANDESEDEEELRRIALATFMKRKATIECSESQNVGTTSNVPVPESSDINSVQILNNETSNLASDNYEVVDMEVDEDDQHSIEIETSENCESSKCSENLFVIDTNPSVDFQGNKENSFSKSQTSNNSTDDEFETDILRAELIEKMYGKKSLPDGEQKPFVAALPQKQTPVLPEKKSFNYQKPKVNFHRKSLQSAKHVLRKATLNKPGNLKRNVIKPTLQIPASKLIIALNEESTSEDSDTPDSNSVSENPVESIVALISDIRQKSDSSEKTKDPTENIPEAVSCLSKAQQEEYNALMKILAEKTKLAPVQDTVPQKNDSVHSPLDDLKKLEGKLLGLKDALKNKKESMTTLSKEINTKKLHYMKAKLSAQHLKEQFAAADKIRKAKLLDWSNACDHLNTVKQSVLDLENKINKVQDLCSKIGSSIKGQTYNLSPIFTSPDNENS